MTTLTANAGSPVYEAIESTISELTRLQQSGKIEVSHLDVVSFVDDICLSARIRRTDLPVGVVNLFDDAKERIAKDDKAQFRIGRLIEALNRSKSR